MDWEDDDNAFSRYTLPRNNVTPGATKKNGLTKQGNSLHFKGKRVKTTSSRRSCFIKFKKYLKKSKNDPQDFIVLVAHNSYKFDAPIIINNFKTEGVKCDKFDGFIDTMHFFKFHFPGLNSYSLDNLCKEFGIAKSGIHEGLQDSKDLKELLRIACKNKEINFENYVSKNLKKQCQIKL